MQVVPLRTVSIIQAKVNTPCSQFESWTVVDVTAQIEQTRVGGNLHPNPNDRGFKSGVE